MSLGRLQERGCALVEPESLSSRIKKVTLTPSGLHARDIYDRTVRAIEERWQAAFGEDTVVDLRNLLERLISEPDVRGPLLFHGLDPYPDGWRAALPSPEVLPHFPMILHRGGWPDGS